jgi:hypothetical protein
MPRPFLLGLDGDVEVAEPGRMRVPRPAASTTAPSGAESDTDTDAAAITTSPVLQPRAPGDFLAARSVFPHN